MSIQVRATAKGYYGMQRYDPGEEFEVAEEKHLASWMERLDGRPNDRAIRGNEQRRRKLNRRHRVADGAVDGAPVKPADEAVRDLGVTDTKARPRRRRRPGKADDAVSLGEMALKGQ